MSNDTTRDAFEVWAVSKSIDIIKSKDAWGNDIYQHPHVDSMWFGWQAATEQGKRQPPYPEGDVVGPCVCGSWPGGKCLKCPWTPATSAKPISEDFDKALKKHETNCCMFERGAQTLDDLLRSREIFIKSVQPAEGDAKNAERWRVILAGDLYQKHRDLYAAIVEGFTAKEINDAADAAIASQKAIP